LELRRAEGSKPKVLLLTVSPADTPHLLHLPDTVVLKRLICLQMPRIPKHIQERVYLNVLLKMLMSPYRSTASSSSSPTLATWGLLKTTLGM